MTSSCRTSERQRNPWLRELRSTKLDRCILHLTVPMSSRRAAGDPCCPRRSDDGEHGVQVAEHIARQARFGAKRSCETAVRIRPAGYDGHVPLRGLEPDDFSSNRNLALSYAWSMIFSENRYPTFRDHALARRSTSEGEWWAVRDSNSRHPACKAGALPTELTAP